MTVSREKLIYAEEVEATEKQSMSDPSQAIVISSTSDTDSDVTLPPSPGAFTRSERPDLVPPGKQSPKFSCSPLLFSDTDSPSSDSILTGETPPGAYGYTFPQKRSRSSSSSRSSSPSLFFGTPSPRKAPAVRPKRFFSNWTLVLTLLDQPIHSTESHILFRTVERPRKDLSTQTDLTMANVEDSALDENKCNKKKKKKRMKNKEHEMTEENVVQPTKKHKKRKRRHEDEQAEMLKEENVKDCKSDDKACDGHKKKKKKKKNKENDFEEDNLTPPLTKKKKKNKHKENEITEEPEDVHIKEDGEPKKKRKKKKKNKESEDDVTDNVDIVANEKLELKKKKRRSKGSGNDNNVSNDDENNVSLCKKFKSSKGLIATVTVHEEESVCVKKTKKKRKHSLEGQEAVQEAENSPKKQKKDSKSNGEIDLSNESNLASNVNKGIPSGAKQNATEPIVGQWGTSSLGSDTRQQKFLRLMGGFKKGTNDANSLGTKKSKGLFGSLKATPAVTNLASQGGNRAMDASQEKNYLTNMEKDYERAMSMNLKRGIGLGFEKPPGEGKKFYIDTKTSKSIKFDD